MSKRVSKRATESKEIVLLEGEQVDVGVDTHSQDNRVAMWSEQRQAIVAGWVQPSDPHALAKKLLPHKAQIGRIVYEAGPTGYRLARVLRKAGFRCDVVAPSRTPVATGQEAKSDRLDSRIDGSLLASIDLRSTRPGPTICSWPTNSSKPAGRMRAASGASLSLSCSNCCSNISIVIMLLFYRKGRQVGIH